jgi:hypothetical protein
VTIGAVDIAGMFVGHVMPQSVPHQAVSRAIPLTAGAFAIFTMHTVRDSHYIPMGNDTGEGGCIPEELSPDSQGSEGVMSGMSGGE